MNTTGVLIPYMRKSSGEDPAGSLARQRGAIRRWAEANGVELAPEVWEPNVSGKRRWQDRGLGDALEAVERGEAAGIICEEQSRLSRENMKATAEVWEAFQRLDARLVCTAEGTDTATGDHELSFTMRAALAREQWKQYARRMADVKERKLRDGLPLGPVPFGYRRRPDRRVEVDPLISPLVREVYERRASGEGMERLAAFLDGKAPKARGRWSRQAVAFMLANPIYHTGRLHYGDLVSEWDAGACVDAPLWHAVQRSPTPVRPRSGRWLLTGLVTCGSCGSHLEPHTSRPGGPGTKAYGYYRCRNRSCDDHQGASAMRLEGFVVRRTLAVEHEFESLAQTPDLEPLEVALATAERRLTQVDTPEAMDALGERWAPNVKARRQEFEEALAALGRARQRSGPGRSFRLADVVTDLSRPELRQALGVFWEEIRLGRNADGATTVTFVPRESGGVARLAEMELPNDTQEVK